MILLSKLKKINLKIGEAPHLKYEDAIERRDILLEVIKIQLISKTKFKIRQHSTILARKIQINKFRELESHLLMQSERVNLPKEIILTGVVILTRAMIRAQIRKVLKFCRP